MNIQNHICKHDKFIVQSFLPSQNRIVNISYYLENIAREKVGCEVGMWIIKYKGSNNRT